jgi:hypothetical protein
MATVTRKSARKSKTVDPDRPRHAGGRPPKLDKLTAFGSALEPFLKRRSWNYKQLAEASGENHNTIWRWAKASKKWPPSDKTSIIEDALGIPHGCLARRRPHGSAA